MTKLLKRILSLFIAVVLVAAFSAPQALDQGANAGNRDVPRDVLVTIQKFYSCEPGKFPDDVSDEDWDRLLEYGGDAATELFYYIAQHAAPSEERVTITDAEFDELTKDSSAPYIPANGPVSYDPLSGEVTQEDVSHIDGLVEQSQPIEGNSQNNADYDQELEIRSSWERVTITDEELDELTKDSSEPYIPANGPVSYDPLSGEVTQEDVSHIDGLVEPPQPTEGNSQNNHEYDQEPEIRPNEYPYFWNEPNPQNYLNTRTTFKLIYRSEGALWVGSAFKINSQSLATAGHNLYTPGDGWSQDMVIIPSWRLDSPQEPYGRAQWTRSTVGGDWFANGDVNDDWGIINVRDANIVPGRLLMRGVGSSSLNGQWTRGQGYIGLLGGNVDMRLVAGNVTSTGRRIVRVQRQYAGGMSGGPVIDRNDRIIGIVNNEKGFIKLDDWIYNYFLQQP